MFANDGVWAHIATATTTQVKGGKGVLHTLTVNTTAAGTISIYDDLGPVAGNLLAVLKASVAEQTFTYDIAFTRGLTIVTAAASDITISFQ